MSENATLQRLESGISTMPTEWPQDKRITDIPSKQSKTHQPALVHWEIEQLDQLNMLHLPCEISIGSLLDDRLRLRVPLTLKLEQENDFYIARLDEVEEFGYGYTTTHAIDDFRQTLAELYWTLKNEQLRLSQNLAIIRDKLNQIVQEI